MTKYIFNFKLIMRAEDVNVSQTPVQMAPEKSVDNDAELSKSNTPSEEEINAAAEEMYQRYMSRRGMCRTQDFVVVSICIGILVYVWVKIYKQPIPPMILHLLGMDDPVFEKPKL